MKHSNIAAHRPTFEFSTYITRGRNEREYEVEVTYTVSPYIPAQGPTYACGGQPAEGGEVEILSAKLIGDSHDLTEAEWQMIQEDAERHADDDLADYWADYGDYLRDSRCDDELSATMVAPVGSVR